MAKALGAATYRGRCSPLFWARSPGRGSRCACRESSLALRLISLRPDVPPPATQSLGHEMLLNATPQIQSCISHQSKPKDGHSQQQATEPTLPTITSSSYEWNTGSESKGDLSEVNSNVEQSGKAS